jgi:hypothetical protein
VGVSAPGVVASSQAERLPAPGSDAALAANAAVIALRRHARGHAPGPGEPRTGGRDLRDVRLVVGSGGVLRHGGGEQVLDAVLGDTAGGWPIPDRAKRVIDTEYVLAAAGLLASDHADVALHLLNAL